MKILVLALAVAIFSVALSAPVTARAEDIRNPLGLDAAAADEGRKLYDALGCVACHGNNARGAVGPDLTDNEWLRAPSDEMIFNVIKNGRSGTLMSPFRDVAPDEQIWQLVTYLRDENRKRREAGEFR
ncbi:MAG: c-type cytochrome [Burkholderiales bacterium]|nr:c-type cytochrome [Burkholderiales bacterium]